MTTAAQQVENLKAEGKFFRAGALAYRLGLPRYYGCHVGMRSTLEVDRDEFFDGYDRAIAKQKSSKT